ncbi:MAG: LysE family transporter [Azospirillaceae bacterium]|nr:LysE family transporter [Azospirillaceae bacterium]
MSILLRGIAMGWVIAAPVGPIGLLCIRRTIRHGLFIGFATGMGAALADTFYGAVAASGVTAALRFMTGHLPEFRLIGGVFLVVIAIKSLRYHPSELTRTQDTTNWLAAFGTGIGLTITNPLTIFAFIGIFAGFGIDVSGADALVLVGGVFLGSSLWWLMLSSGVNMVRDHLTSRSLDVINRTAGIALLGFGGYALVTAYSGFTTQMAG